jgi:hypothetical protein
LRFPFIWLVDPPKLLQPTTEVPEGVPPIESRENSRGDGFFGIRKYFGDKGKSGNIDPTDKCLTVVLEPASQVMSRTRGDGKKVVTGQALDFDWDDMPKRSQVAKHLSGGLTDALWEELVKIAVTYAGFHTCGRSTRTVKETKAKN